MDWKEVTENLYNKISPIRGSLNTQIDRNYIEKQIISSVWIEFDMNEFAYVDPFYGEQKSTSNFKMLVEPLDGNNEVKITHAQELENKIIRESANYLKGYFSNSLHFSAPLIKFGKIIENKIGFEMEYCLTNSYSYGIMTGTIDEHIQSKGKVELDLSIQDMLILVAEEGSLREILELMNPNIYDLEFTKEVSDTDVIYKGYDQYRVPYKSLKYDIG